MQDFLKLHRKGNAKNTKKSMTSRQQKERSDLAKKFKF